MFVSQLLNLDGAQMLALLGFAGILFAVLLARYVVIVGPLYLLCWKLLRRRLQPRRIQRTFPTRRRMLAEVLWSLSTFVVFSLVGVTLMEMSRAGWTRMYPSIDDHGWGYWAVSIALMLVLHDAYFYWTHRFMHLPGVFRRVHRVHHLSFNPSPWAAFSFHPLEAVIEAGVVLVIAVIIPFHPSAMFVFLLIMTLMNALGHLGYELYPGGFTRHRVGQWLTTSVHHNMHHHYVHRNYALYFTWWDRLMGTLDNAYHTAHDAVTPRRAGDQGAGASSCAPSVELAAQRNPK
jgi:sterol desaturase/sphingolipid hydroxylase (fatty acid hydroxylase superfamily)